MVHWFALFGIISLLFVMASHHSGAVGESLTFILWPVIYVGRFLLFAELLRRYLDPVYVFGAKGLSARKGRLSLHLKTVTVRYNDIREFRVEQNILGRLLGYGTILIGTASTNSYEVIMTNVAHPHQLLEWIWSEKLSKQSTELARVSPNRVTLIPATDSHS